MPEPVLAEHAPPAGGRKFRIMFIRDTAIADNARFIGPCDLVVERGRLFISGRRYISDSHSRRISHGYSLTKVLVNSIVGLALYPAACMYVYAANMLLTKDCTLEFDLKQLCDVYFEWDMVSFNVRDATGGLAAKFFGFTNSIDETSQLAQHLALQMAPDNNAKSSAAKDDTKNKGIVTP